MKHLKLFENKYENQPSDWHEWEQPLRGKNSSIQTITQSEIDKLTNFMELWNFSVSKLVYPISFYKRSGRGSLTVPRDKKFNFFISNINDFGLVGYKIEDDWFQIKLEFYKRDLEDMEFFKCDSIEGLIEQLQIVINKLKIQPKDVANLKKEIQKIITKTNDRTKLLRIKDFILQI